MSRKRHRTRSRVLDPATGAGRDWGRFSQAVSASAAPGADTPGLDPSGVALPGAVPAPGPDAVVRRTPDGWRVGDDELPDLTSAMVLADLLAAELPTEIQPAVPPAPPPPAGATQPDIMLAGGHPADGRPAVEEEAHRLRTTVGQLEHALTARIRVEQAIGVLAERHRIRPRQAFEQLRSAARNRGRRVIDIAADVVASATNPLLQLPEELARQRSAPRHSARHSRRVLRSE
jgi:ANTAR domain